MSKTRKLAENLRQNESGLFGRDMRDAATAIDTLLDAIEAGGMVEPRPAPVMDLGPLRTLRDWHWGQAKRIDPFQRGQHRAFVASLNQYFPPDDQL